MNNKHLMLPDVVRPPTRTITPEPTPTRSSNGLVITGANMLVTLILISGMLINNTAVLTALIIGACYFLVSTTVFHLTDNGTLAALFATWQAEKTERFRVSAYVDAIEIWASMQQPQLPSETSQTSVERLSPLNGRYVPAYTKEAKQEAMTWLATLYDVEGEPDPRKVGEDGRLMVRMIGSKRGGGSKDAGLWLLRQGFITRVEGGYALNISLLPHRRNLMHFQ